MGGFAVGFGPVRSPYLRVPECRYQPLCRFLYRENHATFPWPAVPRKRGALSQTTAYIFNIGRELLEGLVLDRNANFMAGKLNDAGCRVRSIQVLGDDEESLVKAFQDALSHKPAFILTTGGMGPGHDDITRQCVARAAGLPLLQDDAAADMVAKSYRRLAAKGVVKNQQINDARLRMAMLPEGAIGYENPIGTAPAVRLAVGDTQFFLLPGVPAELQRLFNLYALPVIQTSGQHTAKKARHIDYPGRDESALARVLADTDRRYHGLHARARPQGDDPSAGLRITITAEHGDEAEVDRLLELAEADLRARLGLEVTRGSSGSASE